MNAEQIADELIAQRTRRRVAEQRPKRVRSRKLYARPLNIIEVCEFKAAVKAAIKRKELLSRSLPAPAEGTALRAGLTAGLLFSKDFDDAGLGLGDQRGVDAASPTLERQSAASALGVE